MDLIAFLKKLGANINVYGRKIIISEKASVNQNVNHKIIFDRIEAGTYLIAGSMIGKKITIKKIDPIVLKI